MGYWKAPSTRGNPGVNPVLGGPAARLNQQTSGNPGVNPAFNGPAQRIANMSRKPKRPVSKVTTGLVQQQPMTIADRARARIAALYDPVIQQITDSVNRRVAGQQQTIMGHSKELAGEMSKYVGSFGNIYGQAQASQAAADAATVQRLEGGGSALANELSGVLTGMNAPAGVTGDLAGQAVARGTGAANAAYARGSADLTRLIAQGATEQTYAAKQPGFVLQRGQQDVAAAGRQGAADIEEETSALRAKIPGDTASLIDQYTSEAKAEKEAKAKAKQDQRERAWEAATLKVAYGLPLTKADKRVLAAGYGANPDAVQIQGKLNVERAQKQWESAEKRAAEAREAARKAAEDARDHARDLDKERRDERRKIAAEKRAAARKAAEDARKAKLELQKARIAANKKKTSGSSSSSSDPTLPGEG